MPILWIRLPSSGVGGRHDAMTEMQRSRDTDTGGVCGPPGTPACAALACAAAVESVQRADAAAERRNAALVVVVVVVVVVARLLPPKAGPLTRGPIPGTSFLEMPPFHPTIKLHPFRWIQLRCIHTYRTYMHTYLN